MFLSSASLSETPNGVEEVRASTPVNEFVRQEIELDQARVTASAHKGSLSGVGMEHSRVYTIHDAFDSPDH